jgi:hypothetical protein
MIAIDTSKKTSEILLTKKKFSEIIEVKANEHSMSILDTILWYCEEYEMEIESAAKLLTPNIKEKMYMDAYKNHVIDRGVTRPILPI